MDGKLTALAVGLILVCVAGCGSSRIAALETDMEQLTTQVSDLGESDAQLWSQLAELSNKVDKAVKMRGDLETLTGRLASFEVRVATQAVKVQELRDAYLSMLKAYRGAQHKLLESIDSSIKEMEQ